MESEWQLPIADVLALLAFPGWGGGGAGGGTAVIYEKSFEANFKFNSGFVLIKLIFFHRSLSAIWVRAVFWSLGRIICINKSSGIVDYIFISYSYAIYIIEWNLCEIEGWIYCICIWTDKQPVSRPTEINQSQGTGGRQTTGSNHFFMFIQFQLWWRWHINARLPSV